MTTTLKFLFCGKGDTTLIQCQDDQDGSSRWGLVDCCLTKQSGSYYRIRELVETQQIDTLDFVCLTHPHRDHYFGMDELLKEMFCDQDGQHLRVREFWDSGIQFRLLAAIAYRLGQTGVKKEMDSLYRFLHGFSFSDRLEHRILNLGGVAPIEFGDFYFLCLSPRTNRVDRFNQQTLRKILTASDDHVLRMREEANSMSVILLLLHRTLPVNIILGGDAGADAWAEALSGWSKLAGNLQRADTRFAAVKVSHHGAFGRRGEYLHSELYSRYCAPNQTIAILSVGECDANHPHNDVLTVLKDNGIAVYATCKLDHGHPFVQEGLPRPGYCARPKRDTYVPDDTARWWADIEISIGEGGIADVQPRDFRIV